jgi:hypothetical protein
MSGAVAEKPLRERSAIVIRISFLLRGIYIIDHTYYGLFQLITAEYCKQTAAVAWSHERCDILRAYRPK